MSTTTRDEHFCAVDEVTDHRTSVPEPDGALIGHLEPTEERFDIEWEALAHQAAEGTQRFEELDSHEALLDERLRALACSLAAGDGDVRGCLILSKDGLVLASHPDDVEVETRHAWARFAALGDLERGFAKLGAETWCFVRLGPYEAFAITVPGARPGLVIDRMEQVLLAAEGTWSDHPEPRRETAAASPHTTEPRTQLHPESRPAGEPVVITGDVPHPAVAPVANAAPTRAKLANARPTEATQKLSITDETAQLSASSGSPTDLAEYRVGEGPEDRTWEDARRSDEVDLFSLASEFGQLL